MANANYLWYPEDADGQADFQDNLNVNLVTFKTKYNITGETIDRVAANAAWMRFWVDYRREFDIQSEQLTKYYNALALGKDAGGAITAPVITAPAGQPAEAEPDVKTFTYALRREIVNKSNYSVADGELLGFEPPQGTNLVETEITATFKNRTLANFDLDITFSKQEQDALRLEARRKGGDWARLDTLTTNGTVHVAPTTPGEAEQIELRAILLKKNQPIGNYSDIQTALIAP